MVVIEVDVAEFVSKFKLIVGQRIEAVGPEVEVIELRQVFEHLRRYFGDVVPSKRQPPEVPKPVEVILLQWRYLRFTHFQVLQRGES